MRQLKPRSAGGAAQSFEKRLLSTSASLLVVLLTASAATAGSLEDALFSKKHMLSAGGAQQTTDAIISASTPDFEPVALTLDDLGVDDRDYSYYVEYRYRFKPEWSLFAGSYSFSGSGGITNSRDFSYDGVEFTTNSELNASLDVDAFIASVMYRAYRNESLEIMVGGGIHALDLGAAISGEATLNDNTADFRQAGTTLLAPVPNLRVAANWAINDRFGVNFVGGWLSANVDDYDGAFLYGHLRAIYRLTASAGVSLGYQLTDVDITQTRQFSKISYDLRLRGPTLTLSYSF